MSLSVPLFGDLQYMIKVWVNKQLNIVSTHITNKRNASNTAILNKITNIY